MTLISGNSLQWLDALPYWNIRSGDRLPTFQPNGASGIMWWKGTSLTIVKTQASGNYLLRLFVENAQHNSDFIVLVNDEEISHISIKGFGVSEYTVDAVLNSGLNIIAINFPNDIGDLIIHEIQVIRI